MDEKHECETCGKEAHQVHHKDEDHKNNKEGNLQWLCTLCHAKVHGIEPKRSELKELVILRDRAIRIRNALDNQIRGFGRIEYVVPEHWGNERKAWDAKIKAFEKDIRKKMKTGDYKAWPWLSSIKGISEVTAAKLISYIDINNTPHISSLWRYCGLDATHIKRTRKITKEEALKFGNPYLKKELMGILADSFIRQRTPVYREVYDKEKERQLALMSQNSSEIQPSPASHKKTETQTESASHPKNETQHFVANPPKNKMHAHLRAKRKAVKLFLSHFWVAWREAEGLPVSRPYVETKLGHKHIIEPVKVKAK